MSLYGEYVKERLGDEIVEGLYGFATYRFLEQDNIPCVYIVDIYVKPEYRKTNVASDMADEIVRNAKERGYRRLLGSVSSVAKNPTESTKVLLAYGMTIHSFSNDGLIFKKEI